ncbi:suppressor of tumorigenicity 14 protein-like [Haliotis rufescens]|uniref:suppressor of tumorigenicity 14 protein-like n=1 Tax=Haliotis rufescens TaxID=6454 RepID=UPI00201F8A72|nr:suppressor of tumorigenicity 14 protein-like [Haliotis rufescens]
MNGASGDCGIVDNTVYTAPTGSMSFRFKTDYVTQTGQFDILVTAFSSSPCSSRRFQCDNDHCVSNDLKCNGFDDCGDNSDENSGCDSILGTGAIAGIAVGAIVFIVIVVVLSIVGRVYRRRHCVTDTHCHASPPPCAHPPTCAPASYPSTLSYGY